MLEVLDVSGPPPSELSAGADGKATASVSAPWLVRTSRRKFLLNNSPDAVVIEIGLGEITSAQRETRFSPSLARVLSRNYI